MVVDEDDAPRTHKAPEVDQVKEHAIEAVASVDEGGSLRPQAEGTVSEV